MSKLINRIAVAAAVAAVLLLVLALPALARRSVFTGSWRGINDPGDQSTITIHIGGPRGDGTYNVLMFDTYSTACYKELEESVRDRARMEGVASDNTLVASGMLWCLTRPPQPLWITTIDLAYQSDGTLLMNGKFTFHRQGSGR